MDVTFLPFYLPTGSFSNINQEFDDFVIVCFVCEDFFFFFLKKNLF